ncbi:MAG TPA: LysM domain-containing protein [Methanothrix sp.]|nr:LysM domain-containing protein [Methanothrix sp.]
MLTTEKVASYDDLSALVKGLKKGETFTVSRDTVSPDLIDSLDELGLSPLTVITESGTVDDEKKTATVTGNAVFFDIAGMAVTMTFKPEDPDNLSGPFLVTIDLSPPEGTQWELLSGFSMENMVMVFEPDSDLKIYHASIGCDLLIGKRGQLSLPIRLQIPSQKTDWILIGDFDSRPLTPETFSALSNGMDLTTFLPSPLNALTKFGLSRIDLAFDPSKGALSRTYFVIEYSDAWSIFNIIKVKKGDTRLNFAVDFNNFNRSYIELVATFEVATVPLSLGAHFAKDNFIVWASLPEGSVVNIKSIFEYFNIALPAGFPEIDVYRFGLLANISDNSYNFNIGMEIDTKTALKISDLSADVCVARGKVDADFSATFEIEDIIILLRAKYDGAGGGLKLEGKTENLNLTLQNLVDKLLPGQWPNMPGSIGNIGMESLSASFDTKTKEFSFDTIVGWTLSLEEFTWVLDAEFSVQSHRKTPDTAPTYSGYLSGNIKVNELNVLAKYSFDAAEKAVTFQIEYKGFQLVCAVSKNKDNDTVLTVSLGGVTFGEILDFLVHLVDPNLDFELDPPWNVLNQIDLKNLVLRINLTKNTVGFDCIINADLNFIKITSIGLTYVKRDGEDTVDIKIVGSFLGKKYDGGWDLLNEKPPEAPGAGSKYFDLRLLALGQHVEVEGIADCKSVVKAIKKIETLPVPSPAQLPAITFSPESSWMVATDFGILRVGDTSNYFLTLQTIFNDPNIYALRVALAGPAAKILAGLDFEIMYRRISETVGVYSAQIQLPDKMRNFQMGAFNITLPVFAIELYTNGDFKVDVGFPWKLDFSRSFTIQAQISFVPVIGSGGIYFGKLSSATSNQVPAVTNGTFNPVIIFGLGLQLGVGKYIEKGILRAGFSITMVGIVEGVIARWNPYEGPDNGEYYYWLQGTLGIIGKLFGGIDFGIVKADVNVTVSLVAQITYECYKDIPISVIASVDVSLSIKINCGLFKITIHFSFSARIKETFTIKNSGTPPWTLADRSEMEQQAKRDLRLRAPLPLACLGLDISEMNWNNYKATTTEGLNAYFVPVLSASADEIHGVTGPHACYVPMLLIESTSPSAEDELDKDTSFEKLCKHVLRWTVAAAQDHGMDEDEINAYVVSDDELLSMMDYLSDSKNSTPIEDSDAIEFMKAHFSLEVTYEDDDGDANAAVFPMPPDLTLKVPSYNGSEDLEWKFSEFNSLGDQYRDDLRTRFDRLAVQVEEEMEKGSDRRLLASDELESPGRSMASFVFADYFLLLARQMVQNARDGLRNFQYLIGTSVVDPAKHETVQGIVDWVNNQMAPGSDDFKAEDLFEANGQHPLNPDKNIQIQGLTYQVQGGDTLSSIARDEHSTAETLASANASAENILTAGMTVIYGEKPEYVIQVEDTLQSISDDIFGCSLKDLITNSDLKDKTGVLVTSCLLSLPTITRTTNEGDTLASIAAVYDIPVKQLAAATGNLGVEDLFSTSSEAQCLNVPHLERFRVCELIDEIQRTKGLQHLSGMASRYLLHGMRLPTAGIDFKDDSSGWPEEAGLYALTGQQFPIPTLTDDNFCFSLVKGDDLSWIEFQAGESENELKVTVKGDDASRASSVQKAVEAGIVPKLEELGSEQVYSSQPMTYPFTSVTLWHSPDDVDLPYSDQSGEKQSLRIWSLPASLMDLSDSRTGDVLPKMSIQVGTYNEATSEMDKIQVNSYGWGTLIEVGIKKIEQVSESPSTRTTYELAGANERGILLLERLLQEIHDSDKTILDLKLLYRHSPVGSVTPSLQSDKGGDITMFISQVNLTTETRPPETLQRAPRALAEADEQRHKTEGCLDTAYDFIRMLWENSITRSGGYYLYYNYDGESGFPESIFNDKGDATISLLVIYAKPDGTEENGVASYMNCAVTGDSIDPSRSVVFAMAEPLNLECAPTSDESLADIAQRYFMTPIELVEDNPDHPLVDGKAVIVSSGTYMVSPIGTSPGGRLSDIAAYFKTTEEAIREANPRRVFECKPGPDDSLASIADSYHITLAELAQANKDHLLTEGKTVDILRGTYKVRSKSPGCKLPDIAAYFKTTEENIKAANPNIDPWPEELTIGELINLPTINVNVGVGPGDKTLAELGTYYGCSVSDLAEDNKSTKGLMSVTSPLSLLVAYDAIHLPQIQATVGVGQGGRTYASLASFYGCSISDLAEDNKSTKGLMSAESQLSISGGPNMKTATVPAGATPIGAKRIVSAEAPDDPRADEDFGQLYLQQTFSMLGYRVFENLDFGKSDWGLPMGPVETPIDAVSGRKIREPVPPKTDDGLWKYHQALPYPRFAEDEGLEANADMPDPKGSPYLGIGDLLQVNFGWQDIFGNVARTPLSDPSLDEGAPANNQPILVGYTDQLIGLGRWPNVSSSYKVLNGGDSANLIITLAFDPTVYSSSEDVDVQTESSENPKQSKAEQDLRVYKQLYYQLLQTAGSDPDPEPVKISVETSLLEPSSIELSAGQSQDLMDWIETIYQFLSDIVLVDSSEVTPGDLDIVFPIAKGASVTENGFALNAVQIFELTVAMKMERPVAKVQSDLKDAESVYSVATPIHPAVKKTDAAVDPYSMRVFALNFEEALNLPGSYQLKVATGTDRKRVGTSSSSKSIWAVRLGANGISYSVKNPGSPKIFAPKPISNKPESRLGVPIYDYISGNEIDFSDPTRTLDFVGIDMDVWVREFLAAVDKFLMPEYISPARLLMVDGEQDLIGTLLEYKKSLAESISDLLIPVFDDELCDGQDEEAREAFRQQLLVRLSNAYSTNAVIQFEADVNTGVPQPDDPNPPRIYGAPVPEDDTESQNGDVSLTTAKLVLENRTENLTFLMQTKDTKQGDDPSSPMQSYVPLDLSFRGLNIEHEIGELPGIYNYEASSWLSFVNLPEGDGDFSLERYLGKFDVPLVLRAIPTPPSMIGQTGLPSSDDINASNIDKAVMWDYSFVYSQSYHEPQDDISFRVVFNLKPASRALSRSMDDIFPALAEFVTVYPAVAKDLDGVLREIDKAAEDGERSTALKALESFVNLVGRVAKAWAPLNDITKFAGDFDNMRDFVDACEFSIKEMSKSMSDPDRTAVEALMVRVSLNGNWPSGIDLPKVAIEEYDTVQLPSNDSEIDFVFRSHDDGKYLTASLGRAIPGRTVTLPQINVMEEQSARSTSWLSRNETLVPERKTASPFVYRTSEIQFANPHRPKLRSDDLIDISLVGSPDGEPVSRRLAEHLSSLFENLFKNQTTGSKDSFSLQLECSYEYRVNSELPWVTLPVLFVPSSSFDPSVPRRGRSSDQDTSGSFVSELSQEILRWFEENSPYEGKKGILKFDLTLLSNLTVQSMPLLRLSNLSLPLDWVTDLPTNQL